MKEKIISKSEELFFSLGFKSVTMDDIANAMGISKKTIYAHFSNKTELVEVVTFSVLDHISEGIDRINAASINPIEELYDIKMFVINYLKSVKVSPQHQLKKYYPQIYERLQIKQFEKMHSSFENSLKMGMNTGLFRPDIDVNFISRLYFNGVTAIRDISVFPESDFDKNYLFESYLEYHLRAITTLKGLNLLNNFTKSNLSSNAS
ncbi:transcriptional regulator, TetR family [Formosa sp. Hel1_33_131]|uniref:TetR/AcrR family transcriptional regulator n=1 Tax=Formosa sp. Hel1_33_131 TaxID=1336794 RepID=UPI00084E0D90|nr:TetR/AcrR family transcriptional regulator [Formosa sp. Hel1_33_131]AOR28512.1 transcriptional regulator, TetR family [Formosa sp. Hel1_33_131]